MSSQLDFVHDRVCCRAVLHDNNARMSVKPTAWERERAKSRVYAFHAWRMEDDENVSGLTRMSATTISEPYIPQYLFAALRASGLRLGAVEENR